MFYNKILILLLIAGASVPLQAAKSTLWTDRIKDRCVSLLPENKQEQARIWFWPTVVCTAVTCIVLGWWAKAHFFPNPRQAFADMVHDLLTSHPLKNDSCRRGIYSTSVEFTPTLSGILMENGNLYFHTWGNLFAQLEFSANTPIGTIIDDAVAYAMQNFAG